MRFFGKPTPAPNPMIEAADKFRQNPTDAAAFVDTLKNEVAFLKKNGRVDNAKNTIKTAAKTAKELNQPQTAADILSCILPLYVHGKNHVREKIMILIEIDGLYSAALGRGRNGEGKELEAKLQKNVQTLDAEYKNCVYNIIQIKDIKEKMQRMNEAAELIRTYNPLWAQSTLKRALEELKGWYYRTCQNLGERGDGFPSSEETIRKIHGEWYLRISKKITDLEWDINLREQKDRARLELKTTN